MQTLDVPVRLAALNLAWMRAGEPNYRRVDMCEQAAALCRLMGREFQARIWDDRAATLLQEGAR